jgi:hypothetical protein
VRWPSRRQRWAPDTLTSWQSGMCSTASNTALSIRAVSSVEAATALHACAAAHEGEGCHCMPCCLGAAVTFTTALHACAAAHEGEGCHCMPCCLGAAVTFTAALHACAAAHEGADVSACCVKVLLYIKGCSAWRQLPAWCRVTSCHLLTYIGGSAGPQPP